VGASNEPLLDLPYLILLLVRAHEALTSGGTIFRAKGNLVEVLNIGHYLSLAHETMDFMREISVSL